MRRAGQTPASALCWAIITSSYLHHIGTTKETLDTQLNKNKIYQVNTDDGRSIRFAPGQMAPLDFHSLANSRTDGLTVYPCEIHGITPSDTTGMFDQDEGQRLTMSMTMNTPFGLGVIGLVMGGWLPPIEAAANRMIVPDRNVVSEIQARFLGGQKRPTAGLDAIDFLAGVPLHIFPLLFALEGNQRRFPKPTEVIAQYSEAAQKLRKALPLARIDDLNPALQRAILGMAQKYQVFGRRNLAFLREAVPLLASPVAKSRQAMVWEQVLSIAHRMGTSPRALPVIACLSTVVCPQGSSPARNLLKPRAKYTEADAYNANADLMSLEVLMQFRRLFKNQEMTLMTADRNLALFWAGLGISRVDGPDFQMGLGEDLFPGVPRDQMLQFAALPGKYSRMEMRPIAAGLRRLGKS